MAQGQFQLSLTNPNDSTGGGGCICDEIKQTDCQPPYVVCYGNSLDSAVSPHVVACARCIGEMSKLLGGEAAVVGNLGDERTVNPEQLTRPFPEQRAPAQKAKVRRVKIEEGSGKPAI